jgi:hypothetical protein
VTSLETFLELLQHSARATKEHLCRDKPTDINPFVMVVREGRLACEVVLGGIATGDDALEYIGEVTAQCAFGFDAELLGFNIDIDIAPGQAVDVDGLLVVAVDREGRMISSVSTYRYTPEGIRWQEPMIDSALVTVALRRIRRQIAMAFMVPKAGGVGDLLVETARRMMHIGHAVIMVTPPAGTEERLKAAGVVVRE